ncbi:MAG: 4Fe-4S binding protein [Clostridia bacterium]|nr:4Fe-4S binding protein [Clostridia bacterium]
MFEKTGVASREMVMTKFPPVERINKGPVAVVECYQKIPCNPCQTACPAGAIRIGEDINDIPERDESKCTGCGLCVSRCPGLSIMIVDGSKSADTVEFRIPYEFLPLPGAGEKVTGLDRAGQPICEATVKRVMNPPSFDRTPVVVLEVDRKYLYDFRNFRREA